MTETPSAPLRDAALATELGESETLHSVPGPRESVVFQRGTLLGRYLVVNTLGAGAMGVVLAAYDPELDRKVAIKLLKHIGDDRQAARARLQREAQALAKLDHGNVVGVFDVGVHAGQLFVAMEFVEGKTLGTWMREAEAVHPWPRVLQVFMQAGRGLAAAHAAGLVHRDFKPDNVMLGDDGRVRVMDFGLVRTEDEAPTASQERQFGVAALNEALTQAGTLLGTPAYMAPEQLASEPADARSDQFGFCVALWEALYGQRPFGSGNLVQLVDRVTRGEVIEPARGSKVPGWIRRVLLRGLSVEPDERWPSMQALLDALADDPAVRRRRWWAGAGVVGLLAAGLWWAATLGAATQQRPCENMQDELSGVWDETAREEVRSAIEATQIGHAPKTASLVEGRLDEYAQQWVAARVDACEATQRGEQSSELLDLRMACLDERLRHVQATVEVLANADGEVVNKAVEVVAGLPRLERCSDPSALRADVPPPEDPEVAREVEQLDAILVKAEALERAGKYDDGLALAQRVVERGAPLGYEPLMARAWLRLGSLQDKHSEYAAAEETLGLALDAALANHMRIQAGLAAAQLMWVVGVRSARYDEARRWAALSSSLSRASMSDEVRARHYNSLGLLARAEGNYEEARSNLEQALALREKLFGSEHPDVASVVNNLGSALDSAGKYEEARVYYERALEIREKVLGPEHPHVAYSLGNLGTLAATTGNYELARSYHARAFQILESTLGPEHLDVAYALNNLGYVADREGKYDESRDYYERALVIKEKALGPDHPDVASALNNLGVNAQSTGRPAEAREYYLRALAIREKALGPDHVNVAISLNNLGSVANDEGRWEEAREYYSRSLAIREKVVAADHPGNALPENGLGVALLGLGEPVEALPHLERALALRSSKDVDPIDLAYTHFALARALWDAPSDAGRDRVRARELATLARTAFAEGGKATVKELAAVESWLASHEP